MSMRPGSTLRWGEHGIFKTGGQRWATLRFSPSRALGCRRALAPEAARWHAPCRRPLRTRAAYAVDTELVMDILRHGEHCEVVGPPELRARVRQPSQAHWPAIVIEPNEQPVAPGNCDANVPQVGLRPQEITPDDRARHLEPCLKFIHAADIHLDSPLVGLAAIPMRRSRMLRTATRDAFVKLIDEAIAEAVGFHGDRWRPLTQKLEGLQHRPFLLAARWDVWAGANPVFLLFGNHDAESEMTRWYAAVQRPGFDARKPTSFRPSSRSGWRFTGAAWRPRH